MKKFSLGLVVLLMISLLGHAQDKPKGYPFNSWEIGINAGVANFAGSTNIDQGKSYEHFNNYKSDMSLGYGMFVRKNFTSVFALEGAFNGTTLSGTPKPENVLGKNFKTGLYEFDLNTVWNMNNLFSSNKFDRKIYWYTKLGVGITHIDNIEYTNPTKMEPWSGWTVPIGTGIVFRLTDKASLNIGTQWSWVNTNRLDGDNQGGTGTDYLIAQIREQYLYTHAGLAIRFGKKEIEPTPVAVVPPPPAPTPKEEPKPEPKPEPQPVQTPPPAPVVVNNTPPEVLNTKTILLDLDFGYDQSNLDSESTSELVRLVRDMRENPKVDVEIATHADSRGTAAYNMKLTERRGQSVMDYLTSKGIDASRVHISAYGETRLTNNCSDGVPCSSAEHAANRRAVATIVVKK